MRGDSNQGEDPRTGRRRLSVSGEHLGGVALEGTGLGMEVGQICGRGVPGLTDFLFQTLLTRISSIRFEGTDAWR